MRSQISKYKWLALLLLIVGSIKAQTTRIITDISPKEAIAGIRTVLTVKGSGFGTNPGSVIFYMVKGLPGDAQGRTAFTTLSWTDTEVKIEIPSPAATGPIGLINFSENWEITGPELKILAADSYPPNAIHWSHSNQINGGYPVYINNEIYNNIDARNAVLRAVQTLRCQTGFNINILGGTDKKGTEDEGAANPEIINKNVNIIWRDDMNQSFLKAGGHGVTTPYYRASNGNYIMAGFDTCLQNETLASGYTWNYGPAPSTSKQLDFESLALHELCHAAGLGHVYDVNDLMYYSLTPGYDTRILQPHHVQAIKYILQDTYAANNIGFGNSPMIPVTCVSSCVDYISVATAVSTGTTDTKQANITVTATNTINTGATADYHAGTEVVMKDGFTALTGSDFKGYIAACVGTTGTTTAKMETPLANETSTTDFVKVYPSPTTGNFTVDVDAKVNKYLLNIFNIEGRMVYRNDTSNHKHNIDITNQPTGLYIVVIISEDGKKYSKKIIKK